MRTHGWIAFTSSCLLATLVGTARAGDCAGTSSGNIPLPDLGARRHLSFEGGLYAQGRNTRPAEHEAAGIKLGRSIEPLDGQGKPDPGGVIGLLAVGMSNAVGEFNEFLRIAKGDAALHPRLRIVHGAIGGRDAREMADPDHSYWSVELPALLAAGSLSPRQVQVVWLKQAVRYPTSGFPDHALELVDLHRAIVQILHQTFPHLKVVYLSSRTYGGYAASELNPEPYAYEQGFAVKWLIDAQIQGDPGLNYDPASGPVLAPWLSWGAYLWADGLRARADGQRWRCSHFQDDGTHPSDAGKLEVARLLLEHFRSDPTATPWFLAAGAGLTGVPARVEAYGTGTTGTLGVPHLFASSRPVLGSAQELGLRVTEVLPRSAGAFLVGLQPFEDGEVRYHDGFVLVDPLHLVFQPADSNGLVTWDVGLLPPDPALAGLTGYTQFVSVDPAGKAGGLSMSRGLAATPGD